MKTFYFEVTDCDNSTSLIKIKGDSVADALCTIEDELGGVESITRKDASTWAQAVQKFDKRYLK